MREDIVSYSDYYPFGQLVPNRHADSKDYRYGFNGMEMDNELKGEGNSINYEARFFDPRVGRFLSLDPLSKKFPMLSPFQFASNTPIWAVDLDGLEARVYTDLSAIPHSFITVIDKDGVINLYTYGQYGQKGTGLGGLYNTGSALVHLKGDDANAYMKHEFKEYSMGVYEISKEKVDKQKIIDYYAKEMQTYNVPAERTKKDHAPNYVNPENGSKAVKYKPYWLTPTGGDNENCSSVANDGLEAGGGDIGGPATQMALICIKYLDLASADLQSVPTNESKQNKSKSYINTGIAFFVSLKQKNVNKIQSHNHRRSLFYNHNNSRLD